VVTWNLEVGSRAGVETAAMIVGRPADLIALQELRPNAAHAIEADADLTEAYPYRVLEPRDDVGGMGLLSRLPILDHAFRVGPILQQATIDLGGGRRLAVINAHPFHADIERLGSAGPPVGLDSAQRNADLVTIRDRIADLMDAHLPVILLGDLNTAASEPAFDRFAAGLRDVHRSVGEGPGWTWRPNAFEFLGIGLVRIDHVVVSPDIAPVSISVACPRVGDHCLVQAELALPAG
jgi:endonuclease/exonuclease/phosphatase family metal-dependent hydrolase